MILVSALAAAFVSCAGGKAADTTRNAAHFRAFLVYTLGPRYYAFRLNAGFRGLDGLKRRPVFSFLYGECQAPPNEACAPPYEVENYDACSRNLANYRVDGGAPSVAYARTTIRGAPAALFPGGQRVEVYTGRTTVVVSGPSADAARHAALRLRALNPRSSPISQLPRPAPGALAGRLRCKR
jgi:hypothetical protein